MLDTFLWAIDLVVIRLSGPELLRSGLHCRQLFRCDRCHAPAHKDPGRRAGVYGKADRDA